MPPHGYSEEELAGLSEEERAAVTADVDPEELTATANPVDLEEEEDGEVEEETPVVPVEVETPVETPVTPEVTPEPEPVKPEPAPVKDEQLPPVNPYEYTDAAKELIKNLREQLADGDMGQAEYEEQADAIKANDYRQRLQAQEDANWRKAVSGFMASEDNQEFRVDVNPVKHSALDGLLRHWATNDPAKIEGLSPREILSKARAEINAQFGGAKQADPKVNPKPTPKPKAVPPSEPNLGDVPAAGVDNPRANTSEFASLDKLTGEALEAAIEKMSPEQQERYLSGR